MAWTAFVAVGLTLAVGASSWGAPARTAAGKAAADVKRALKLGKAADRKATKALRTAREAKAAAKPGAAGPAGAAGATGPAGPAGAAGARGLQGPPGSGVGYAQIEWCESPPCEDFGEQGWFSSDDTNSPGLDNHANFTDPATNGVFCYHDVPFTGHVVVGGIGSIANPTMALPYVVSGRMGSNEHPLTECGFPAGTDPAKTAAIYVRRTSDGALAEPDHAARVFVLFG